MGWHGIIMIPVHTKAWAVMCWIVMFFLSDLKVVKTFIKFLEVTRNCDVSCIPQSNSDYMWNDFIVFKWSYGDKNPPKISRRYTNLSENASVLPWWQSCPFKNDYRGVAFLYQSHPILHDISWQFRLVTKIVSSRKKKY